MLQTYCIAIDSLSMYKIMVIVNHMEIREYIMNITRVVEEVVKLSWTN